MFKNFLALSLSTLVRVLTGMVLFVLVARQWGPALFGQFMYLFSVASILVLACEFGFSQQILREVGRRPEAAPALMASYLGAKVWLTLGAFLLALGFVAATGQGGAAALVLLLLLMAATLQSYSDFLLACLRALGRFSNETAVTIKGNAIYFICGMAALVAGGKATALAGALFGARAVHMLLTHAEYRRHVRNSMWPQFGLGAVMPVIGRSAPYGIDGAVATVFMNVDTILISRYLGSVATGIYQLGARFYQGACLLAPIFGTLYLPRLARALDEKTLFGVHFRQLSLGLTVSGLGLALAFVFSAMYIGLIFHGAGYTQLESLLPWFGLLLFSRFVASVYGTVLTALGGQTVRVIVYLISLLAMIAAALPLMKLYGVVGMVLAVTLAHWVLILGLACCIAYYRLRVHGLLMALGIGALLFAYVYWKTGIKIG